MKRVINDRCSEKDFRNLFASATEELRWLCNTLTGNEELGDRILEAALEQSLKGAGHVFREWMLSWARRLIIKSCIVIAQPATVSQANPYLLLPLAMNGVDQGRVEDVLSLPSATLQQKLSQLEPVQRFVFVLRAIEGCTLRDTALLLNISDRTCEWSYLRAVSAIYEDALQVERSWKPVSSEYAEYSLAQAGD